MRADVALVVLIVQSGICFDRALLADAFRPSHVFARTAGKISLRSCDRRVRVRLGSLFVKEFIMGDNPDAQDDRIVNHPTHPFKLWLEFEHFGPWPDPTDEFCNVDVNTLDGRRYPLNVWTFKVVKSLADDKIADGSSNRGMYLEAPDLLVKELTRPCLEFTIFDLLRESKGNLENWLNDSILRLEFLPPWEGTFIAKISKEDTDPWEQLEAEFSAIMGFDSEEIHCSVEGTHEDSGDVAISANRDGREIYFVVSVCPKTGKIVTDKDNVRKYCNAKTFWEERLGPDIRAYQKQQNCSADTIPFNFRNVPDFDRDYHRKLEEEFPDWSDRLAYYNYDWDELPEDAMNAAKALGYTKKMWDNDNAPELVAKSYWEDLTEEQQKAAKVLDYTEETWDERLAYYNYDWDELPEDAMKAAKALGYTKKMWDNDKDPELVVKSYWEDLTVEQQKAAKVLGYTEETW